jgi:hypothetical protein
VADPSFAFARVLVFTHALFGLRILAVGAVIGAVTYLLLQLLPDAAAFVGQCAPCSAKDRDDVLAALTTAGTTVGTYAAKSTFDTWAGKMLGSTGPANIFKVKKIIDIGSAKNDEEAQDRAFAAYKDLIMINNMPEGSAGRDISDAMDRVKDFSQGRIDVGGGNDDD